MIIMYFRAASKTADLAKVLVYVILDALYESKLKVRKILFILEI